MKNINKNLIKFLFSLSIIILFSSVGIKNADASNYKVTVNAKTDGSIWRSQLRIIGKDKNGTGTEGVSFKTPYSRYALPGGNTLSYVASDSGSDIYNSQYYPCRIEWETDRGSINQTISEIEIFVNGTLVYRSTNAMNLTSATTIKRNISVPTPVLSDFSASPSNLHFDIPKTSVYTKQFVVADINAVDKMCDQFGADWTAAIPKLKYEMVDAFTNGKALSLPGISVSQSGLLSVGLQANESLFQRDNKIFYVRITPDGGASKMASVYPKLSEFSVTFNDKNGKLISTAVEITYGSRLGLVRVPEVPYIQGYTGVWPTDYLSVKSDLVLQPIYTPNAPVFESVSMPAGTVNAAYSGVTLKYTASVSTTSGVSFSLKSGSSLPTGLTLSASGQISGNIGANVAAASYKFTVIAKDKGHGATTEKEFSITVNKGVQEPLTINIPENLTAFDTHTLSTTGGSGTGAVSYRLSSVSPTGAAEIRNGNELVLLKSGHFSITATKAADVGYTETSSQNHEYSIAKKDINLSVSETDFWYDGFSKEISIISDFPLGVHANYLVRFCNVYTNGTESILDDIIDTVAVSPLEIGVYYYEITISSSDYNIVSGRTGRIRIDSKNGLMLRFKNQSKDADITYFSESDTEVFAKLINPTNVDKNVFFVIASYDGNRLVEINVVSESVLAEGFLELSLKNHIASGADTIKTFAWFNKDNIRPIITKTIKTE